MGDVCPSLAKLRRDWKDGADIEVPAGMIAKRVVEGLLRQLEPGQSVTIECIAERRFRVRRS